MPISGGLRGWGEPIASWDYSSGVANVDFTNLGGYRELLIWGDDIAFGGASDAPGLRFSSDNGSSFESTGYDNGDGSGTSFLALSANATGEHGFRIEILDFSHATRKPKVISIGARVGVGSAIRWGTRAAGTYSAIRFYAATLGSNFSAGFIRVYGRA